MVHSTSTALYMGATGVARVIALMALAAGTAVCATAKPGMLNMSTKAAPITPDRLRFIVISSSNLPVVETVDPAGPE